MNNVLILGGAGRVGQFMAKILEPHTRAITIVDLVAPPPQYRHYLLSALDVVEHRSDILQENTTIVFALAEDLAIATLESLSRKHSPVEVIINTCSIQEAFHAKTAVLFPSVVSVGVNFMFSPDLDCRGRSVAVCEYRQSKAGELLETILSHNEMEVAKVAPAEHDALMAVCQSLPHAAILAFALALQGSGFDIETLNALSPPPMKAMLSMVARVLRNSPETYWDIQKNNPGAQQQRDRMISSLALLTNLSLENSSDHFSDELCEVRKYLGKHLQIYTDASAQFFDVLSRNRITS
ncbi:MULTISPECIES: prephenate dehydrogenase dimerization domain-containing protein [Pseudomonas]|uniref:prephenate dehydrogenase dimerization domain-containing protein n=1 Tax=Pseudomonas TaxID=286 RepID=UPI00257BADF8|nr:MULTISPECIES: prephenate dehydrogenase dimerization domain-containing protein [Pseudomonas]